MEPLSRHLNLRVLGLLLPLVFLVHVAEEAPSFVTWFNSLVTPGITERLFLTVNLIAFLITLALGLALAAARERAIAVMTVGWVGFLMLANGIFHIVATIVHWRYSPGTVTAALCYLPISYLVMRSVVRECGVSWPAITAVALLSGVPMYVHGYLIVFEGSRLF